jgi:hypothetical protein
MANEITGFMDRAPINGKREQVWLVWFHYSLMEMELS